MNQVKLNFSFDPSRIKCAATVVEILKMKNSLDHKLFEKFQSMRTSLEQIDKDFKIRKKFKI